MLSVIIRAAWIGRRVQMPVLTVGLGDRNLSVVCELRETADDHLLGRLEATRNRGLSFASVRHSHGTPHDSCVRPDHVHERAARTQLHGSVWYHDDLFERIDEQPDIDELAGPELKGRIRELSLYLYRPCRLINLVIDYGQTAAVEYKIVVRIERLDLQRSSCKCLVDTTEVLLGYVEHHSNGLQLRHHGDAARVRCVYDVAHIDKAKPEASVDRGYDRAVVEISTCVVDRRIVQSYLRFQLRDHGLLGAELLFGDDIACDQFAVALQVSPRVDELRFVDGFLCQLLI